MPPSNGIAVFVTECHRSAVADQSTPHSPQHLITPIELGEQNSTNRTSFPNF